MELTFSPQMHQKYIYMWNDSHRTSTEHWQKTSDLPKGKTISTQLGRTKEKRKKKERKELGRDLHPWEGAVKEERFPHMRKSSHWRGDQTGQRGSFRASEDSRRAWQQACRGQSRERPVQTFGADRHSLA